MRLSIVNLARERISPHHRRTPYSGASLAVLREEYDALLASNANDPDPIIAAIHSALSRADRDFLRRASDDTILKDLQKIRRRRGIQG
jgi:hypothetical protein